MSFRDHTAVSEFFRQFQEYIFMVLVLCYDDDVSHPDLDEIVVEFFESDHLDIDAIPGNLIPSIDKILDGAKMDSSRHRRLLDLSHDVLLISMPFWHEEMIYISMFNYYSYGTVSYTVLMAVVDAILDEKMDTSWSPRIYGVLIRNPDGTAARSKIATLKKYISYERLNPYYDRADTLEVATLRDQPHPEDREEVDKMIEECPLYLEDPKLVDWHVDPVSLWYLLNPGYSGMFFKRRPGPIGLQHLLKIRRMVVEIITTFKEAHGEYTYPTKKSAMSAICPN